MATISELLLQLNQTKAKIVSNLEAKGVKIEETDTFANIGDKIQTIAENEISSLIGFITGTMEVLTIPESITTVRDNLVQNDKNITKAYLPSTLEAIPTNFFNGCTNLQEIYIAKDGEGKYATDGTLTLPHKLWGTNAKVIWKNGNEFLAMFHQLVMNFLNGSTEVELNTPFEIELTDNGTSDTEIFFNIADGMTYTINNADNINITNQTDTNLTFIWKENATKSLVLTVTVTDGVSEAQIGFTTDDANLWQELVILGGMLFEFKTAQNMTMDTIINEEYTNNELGYTVKIEGSSSGTGGWAKYNLYVTVNRFNEVYKKENLALEDLAKGFVFTIDRNHELCIWEGNEDYGVIPRIVCHEDLTQY